MSDGTNDKRGLHVLGVYSYNDKLLPLTTTTNNDNGRRIARYDDSYDRSNLYCSWSVNNNSSSNCIVHQLMTCFAALQLNPSDLLPSDIIDMIIVMPAM